MDSSMEERARRGFDGAFDLAGAELDAALERARALLTAAESDDAFPGATPSAPDAAGPGIGEGPGIRIGAYSLLEKLGEGGFGVVFLARVIHEIFDKASPSRCLVVLCGRGHRRRP